MSLAIEFRQNYGFDQFQRLKARFGGHLRIEQLSAQHRISSLESIRELKEYFLKHPLRGRKHIAQSRWIRAYNLREQKKALPPKGTLEYRRFVRIFKSVNYVKQ